jgi:hypothetical protein
MAYIRQNCLGEDVEAEEFKGAIIFWFIVFCFVVFGVGPWIIGWARIISWFIK